MAFLKNQKEVNPKLVLVLISVSTIAISVLGWINNDNVQTIEELKQQLQVKNETVECLKKERTELNATINKLTEDLDIRINTNSTIGQAKSELVKVIMDAVKSRGEELLYPSLSISELDAMRALKSAEDRILDEYIRVVSLILATMEIETSFKYISRSNHNGTVDYGIMQVNDAVIPEIKEVLGNHMDPINNKNHNVEGGSYEIYDCYILAKEKHPEDVIWWTYAYYNRGRYFEYKDNWKDKNSPTYKKIYKQANTRSLKFKASYNKYYNTIKETI